MPPPPLRGRGHNNDDDNDNDNNNDDDNEDEKKKRRRRRTTSGRLWRDSHYWTDECESSAGSAQPLIPISLRSRSQMACSQALLTQFYFSTSHAVLTELPQDAETVFYYPPAILHSINFDEPRQYIQIVALLSSLQQQHAAVHDWMVDDCDILPAAWCVNDNDKFGNYVYYVCTASALASYYRCSATPRYSGHKLDYAIHYTREQLCRQPPTQRDKGVCPLLLGYNTHVNSPQFTGVPTTYLWKKEV